MQGWMKRPVRPELQLDVDQFRVVIAMVAVGRCPKALRGAPVVNVGDLVDTGDGAVGRARLLGKEFAVQVGLGVLSQRRAREAALLRAVVHQAVFADVQVA